jgi:hypothetical protein
VLALVRVHEVLDQVRGDQRVVAREHHDGAVGVDAVAGGQHGRAGPLAARLGSGFHAVRQGLLDVLTRARYADDAAGARAAGSIDHPMEHRTAAYGMEHLRDGRAHPSAVTRGHDQHGGLGHRGERS